MYSAAFLLALALLLGSGCADNNAPDTGGNATNSTTNTSTGPAGTTGSVNP